MRTTENHLSLMAVVMRRREKKKRLEARKIYPGVYTFKLSFKLSE